jgi:hypothetical protein
VENSASNVSRITSLAVLPFWAATASIWRSVSAESRTVRVLLSVDASDMGQNVLHSLCLCKPSVGDQTMVVSSNIRNFELHSASGFQPSSNSSTAPSALGRQLARKLRNSGVVANRIQRHETKPIFQTPTPLSQMRPENMANFEGCPSHYGQNGHSSLTSEETWDTNGRFADYTSVPETTEISQEVTFAKKLTRNL